MGIIKLSEVEKREDGKEKEGGLRRELWHGSLLDATANRRNMQDGSNGQVARIVYR